MSSHSDKSNLDEDANNSIIRHFIMFNEEQLVN